MMYNHIMGSIKVNSAWSTIKLPYARVSGTWRPCKQIYIKVGGIWKIAFDLNEADPFDGTGSLSGQLTPGYVPWEVLSGTWTEGSGNVSASAVNSVAAIQAGTASGEWEIDTASTTTGGPAVGFWIDDQSNWWGVRYYTEQYTYPIPGNSFFYNHNVTTTFNTRPAGTTNPAAFSSCSYSISYSKFITSNNYINTRTGSRTCSCNTANNANCSTTSSNFADSCGTSCSPLSYPTCTNNNKGGQTSRSCTSPGCAACSTAPCSVCPSFASGSYFTAPCPASFLMTVSYNSFTGCVCGCTALQNYTTVNNAISYNCPTVTSSSSNSSTFACPGSGSLPTCSTTTNNNLVYSTTYSCTPSSTFAGTNATTFGTAIYKRGQLVKSNAGVVNIIANQDFGDVGNLYAKTYGNSVDFKQYSTSGRGGAASTTVTYAAPAGTKGTKHGIIITAVPYTQTYNIGRFKATL